MFFPDNNENKLVGYRHIGAEFSPCKRYRYVLWRSWEPEPRMKASTCVFVMLNPSTADARQDDPTIRGCVQFAKNWGYNRLVVVNLFAYRATDPVAILRLCQSTQPIEAIEGPENELHIRNAAQNASRIICAWGAHGALRDQYKRVLSWIPNYPLSMFHKTKTGQPGHPLYVARTKRPVPYDSHS